jgi:hypothetical protein
MLSALLGENMPTSTVAMSAAESVGLKRSPSSRCLSRSFSSSAAASARRSCSPLVSGLGLFGSGAGLAKIGQCFLMVLGAPHPRFVPFSRAVTGVPRAGRDD